MTEAIINQITACVIARSGSVKVTLRVNITPRVSILNVFYNN